MIFHKRLKKRLDALEKTVGEIIEKMRLRERDEERLAKREKEMRGQDKRMREAYRKNLEKQKRGDASKVVVSSRGIEKQDVV